MNTFKKEERLCSRKHLDLLFKNGSSFLVYPYRITYLSIQLQSSFPAQIVINVPKKRFKRAVDRNLLKRRTREIYRLCKEELIYPYLKTADHCVLLSMQFVGKEIYPQQFLEKKFRIACNKLIKNMVGHALD